MQINATLVKGKARVQFGANKVSDVSGELPVCRLEAFQIAASCMLSEINGDNQTHS